MLSLLRVTNASVSVHCFPSRPSFRLHLQFTCSVQYIYDFLFNPLNPKSRYFDLNTMCIYPKSRYFDLKVRIFNYLIKTCMALIVHRTFIANRTCVVYHHLRTDFKGICSCFLLIILPKLA